MINLCHIAFCATFVGKFVHFVAHRITEGDRFTPMFSFLTDYKWLNCNE